MGPMFRITIILWNRKGS
uniref:Uncharacterized protein n=1 Tax=Arundo donax TaxID=35708 RepID=A0A0A8Y4F8_ARUDO